MLHGKGRRKVAELRAKSNFDLDAMEQRPFGSIPQHLTSEDVVTDIGVSYVSRRERFFESIGRHYDYFLLAIVSNPERRTEIKKHKFENHVSTGQRMFVGLAGLALLAMVVSDCDREVSAQEGTTTTEVTTTIETTTTLEPTTSTTEVTTTTEDVGLIPPLGPVCNPDYPGACAEDEPAEAQPAKPVSIPANYTG